MKELIGSFSVRNIASVMFAGAALALCGDPLAKHFAKVALSTMFSDVRKKAGSVVHQGGRMGLVVRKHSIPRQPRSSAQRIVRGNFGTNAKDWSAVLTQAQRDAWTAFASTLTITDRLGRKFVPSGIQLYQRVSRNLATIAIASIADPPPDQNVSSPLAVTVAATSGPTALSVDVGSDPAANEVPVVFAAPPLSPGISTAGSKLRYIFKAAAAAAGPYNVLSAYVARFGSVPVGKKVFVGVEYINNATGAASGMVTGDSIQA